MAVKKQRTGYDDVKTIIGSGTVVETELLKSEESIKISGQVRGKIITSASLVVAEGALVKGDIEADFLLVAGQIEGNVVVNEQLHLMKDAAISGEVACKSVIIDEGGRLEGTCRMIVESQSQGATNAKANEDKAKQATIVNEKV